MNPVSLLWAVAAIAFVWYMLALVLSRVVA